ncbi:uncharacterized protein LOC142358643 isoform X2 [Convolutriloba macropyga]|uniref:uncharacterized protein LOC142358643 isoform X2 n=1 Tax=Convolutriloba macropyga TaxID=536237 RepID=UPI003F51DDC6
MRPVLSIIKIINIAILFPASCFQLAQDNKMKHFAFFLTFIVTLLHIGANGGTDVTKTPNVSLTKPVHEWNTSDVTQWMETSGILPPYVVLIDGQAICELFRMLIKSHTQGPPDNFYNFVASLPSFDTLSSLKFIYHLRELQKTDLNTCP